MRAPQPGSASSSGASSAARPRDLALQGVDLRRERAAAARQLAGDARLHARRAAASASSRRASQQARSSALGGTSSVERQVVQVPAQAALDAGALGDQVGAVVGEQAQLALGAVEASLGQVGLAQGGAGDRRGVDRRRSCRGCERCGAPAP